MIERKVWARVGSHLLGPGSLSLGSSAWEAARMCASMALDAGNKEDFEAFEDWASCLQALAADHGKLFEEQEGQSLQMESCLKSGDPLACLIMSQRDKAEAVKTHGSWDKMRAGAQKDFQALPEAWREQLWVIEYARKTNVVVKSDASSLPEASARELIAASADLADTREAAGKVGEMAKQLWRERKARGYGDMERLAVELCMRMPIHIGKGKGFISREQKIEMLSEEDRFAPQKAFVAYLPANPSRRLTEGFWGSTNQGGMDLGAAKMFESEPRARQYFERQGFGAFSIVEVSVKVNRVAHTHGKFAGDGLADALARNEREEIVKALEMANIEELRARLNALESESGATPAPSMPSKKSRL
jgi:hypothetical protein